MLAWASDANAALIPYGGGTSVVGGVEARVDGRYDGAVTLDLGALDRVLEVDPVSLAARIQAGASGPALEEQLGEHGLTLRHFPQSLRALDARRLDRDARRAATSRPSTRTSTTSSSRCGRSRRPAPGSRGGCPGSGAGVSPDRMLIGSEGDRSA